MSQTGEYFPASNTSPFLSVPPNCIGDTLVFKFKEVGTKQDSYRKHDFLHCRTTKSGVSQISELYFIQSEEWCHGDITFHNLKFLKLAFLFISRWDASEESFPLLETLAIRECHKLEEISLSFADIPTLKKIKLINCKNESLEASAVNIKQEVTDIEGCDRIDIIIGDMWGNLKKL
ncbi:hypothetical protein P3S67_001260 [Capsicum chacoense]